MSVIKRARHGWLIAPALAVSMMVGCTDDDSDDGVKSDGGADAGPGFDGGPLPGIDSGLDASVDAGPSTGDAGPAITTKTVIVEVSPTGHDRFFGVAHDATGNIYAVGQTASVATANADSSFLLAKFSAAGVLDTSFGMGGYAIKNVVLNGAGAAGGSGLEQARAVVIQSTGKIVVAGYAENTVLPADAGLVANDSDVFVVRFNSDGTIDPSFGTEGVAKFDLGTGVVEPTTTTNDAGVMTTTYALRGADQPWSISLAAEDKLVIHTQTVGQGPSLDGGVRYDSDPALLKLTANGQLDVSFGAGTATPGIVRTDFNQTSVSTRSATVLPNGSIVGSGYSTNSVLTGTSARAQNPVLYKVSADGAPEPSFGATDAVPASGVWHDFARLDMKNAEAYGAAPQGDKFVTLGYGPSSAAPATDRDFLWLRFNSDGTQDRTFGKDGVTFQDVDGFDDNGHALATLSDKRVVGVGRGRPKPTTADAGTPPIDGVVSLITENGQPDTSFGPKGLRTFNFGGPEDNLWAVDVSKADPKQIAAVGIQSGAAPGDDDNGALLILTLP